MLQSLGATRARVFPRFGRSSRVAVALVALGTIAGAARAATVQQTAWRLDGTGVDFGSGAWSGGAPVGSGNVAWDFTFSPSLNQLVATAHVTGTLYLQSTGFGCLRMTLTFRRGTTVLETRTLNGCSLGGDPNLAANQKAVDESFSSPLLDNVVLTTTRTSPLNAGVSLGGGSTGTDTCASQWTRNVRMNDGLADFGSGNHSNGQPEGTGQMRLERLFGPGTASRIRGTVTGTLYYDSLFVVIGPESVIGIDYRNAGGTVIGTDEASVSGTGIDANFSNNQTPVNETFTDPALFQIRARVFSITLGSESTGVERDLRIDSAFAGTANLVPAAVNARVGDPVLYAFSWTVPPGGNWHDLESLRLRFREGEHSVFTMQFNEADSTFALVTERKDGTSRTGPAFAAGSHHKLQTSHVRLRLADSSVVGSGPTSPTVTLNLAFEFEPPAAGHSYVVEVSGADDAGNEDSFSAAGSVVVNRRAPEAVCRRSDD